MTDDVEETLASLEQRLRALQEELDAEGEVPEPPPSAPDALDRFGTELRRLVETWEQTAAALRSDEARTFSGTVALEARGDLRGLCALDRALRDVPGVASIELRSYAGGTGTLEVALDREVTLVAELRRGLAFDLLGAGGGRVSIALR